MKNSLKIASKYLLLTSTLLASSISFAGTINFINMGNGTPGESAWNPLTVVTSGITITVTGHATTDNDVTQFAYLDAGAGGLGVCKDAIGSVNVNHNNDTSNRCNPSSDDNVTVGEYLTFRFDRAVNITKMWFNNNHDGGLGAGDLITIAGNDYNLRTGTVGDFSNSGNGIGSFLVAANTDFNVKYKNEEFYVSGMTVEQVPEPGSLALLGAGCVALSVMRRRIAK